MTKLKVNYFTYLVNILTLFHFKAAFIKSGNGHEKKQNYHFDRMRSVGIYILCKCRNIALCRFHTKVDRCLRLVLHLALPLLGLLFSILFTAVGMYVNRYPDLDSMKICK